MKKPNPRAFAFVAAFLGAVLLAGWAWNRGWHFWGGLLLAVVVIVGGGDMPNWFKD